MQAHGFFKFYLIKLKDIYEIRELKIFTEYVRIQTNIYIYNANFSATSLVWGSLRLAPIILYNII